MYYIKSMHIKVTFQDSLANHFILVMTDRKTTHLIYICKLMHITYTLRELRHDKDTWLIYVLIKK